MVVAHRIPPIALYRKNFGHSIRLRPASQAIVTRRPAKNRAITTVFGPCRAKTVVIARFFAGLRVTVAWLAGLSRMDWPKFFLYNAVGGILWATTIGLAAYYFGQKAVEAVTKYGLYAAAVIVVVAVLAFFGYRWLHRRRDRHDSAAQVKSVVESTPANEIGEPSGASLDDPTVADK